MLKQSGWLACPVCAAGMKLRMAHRGRYAGRDFWGCSRYPSCNEIVNIKPAVARQGRYQLLHSARRPPPLSQKNWHDCGNKRDKRPRSQPPT